jgi:antitoxin PrlF
MNRQARPPSAYSNASVKSQTVLPREVRERLDVKPGHKAPPAEADDPFAAFSEWPSAADKKAYGGL